MIRTIAESDRKRLACIPFALALAVIMSGWLGSRAEQYSLHDTNKPRRTRRDCRRQ
jgi:hypothetical protein